MKTTDILVTYVLNTSYTNIPSVINNEFEEAALIYYMTAVKQGRRPEYIIPFYYPIRIISIYEDYSIVIDPHSSNILKFTHKCYGIGEFEETVKEILSRNIDFYDKLLMIHEALKKALKKPRNIRKYVKGIIVERQVINELMELLTSSKYMQEIPKGYIYGESMDSDNDIEASKNILQDLLAHIEEELEIINTLKNTLTSEFVIWRNKLDKQFEQKYGELQRSITVTRKAIEEKIAVLQSRMIEEIRIIQEKYKALTDTYITRKYNIENEIREIESRMATIRDDSLRSRYDVLVRKLRDRQKEIDKKLQRLQRDEEKETKDIKNKYEKLIDSAKNRLRHMEEETKKLQRIFNSWYNRTYEAYNKVIKDLSSLESKLNKEKNIIESLMVLTPHPGVSTVFIRSYIVGFGGQRLVVTPSRIEKSITKNIYVMKPYTAIFKKLLKTPLNRVKKEINDKILDEYNIIKGVEIEDIKAVLKSISMRDDFFNDINIYLLDKIP